MQAIQELVFIYSSIKMAESFLAGVIPLWSTLGVKAFKCVVGLMVVLSLQIEIAALGDEHPWAWCLFISLIDA
jgi:hypothetical protein